MTNARGAFSVAQQERLKSWRVIAISGEFMSASALLTDWPILHQDRFVVIINKPAGVLSHPNPGRQGEVAAFVGRYDPRERCFTGPAGRVWLIHRLDQDTSGVLLGALDATTAERCRAMFEREEIQKHYRALVRGNPGEAGMWLDHLDTARAPGRVRTVVVKGRPPNAELRFRRLAFHAVERLSWLDIELITGRTHQIRVQAAARQHMLVGDDVYGHFEMNRRLRKELNIRRLCLHARRLTFKHPASGFRMEIEAPLPADLASVLDRLQLPDL